MALEYGQYQRLRIVLNEAKNLVISATRPPTTDKTHKLPANTGHQQAKCTQLLYYDVWKPKAF